MKTIEIPINHKGQVIGADILNKTNWAMLVKDRERFFIKTPVLELNISVNQVDGFCCIRKLGDNYLVASSKWSASTDNAFVLNRDGDVVNSFFIDNFFNDIIILEDRIVVTYIDEGVFRTERYGLEGIAVFDRMGKFLWGYNSTLEKDAPENLFVSDCYASCKVSENTIAFTPYTEFNYLELDCVARRLTRHLELPVQMHGAKALSVSGSTIHTAQISTVGCSIISLDTKKAFQPNSIDIDIRNLRGLPNGQFLGVSDNHISLFSM